MRIRQRKLRNVLHKSQHILMVVPDDVTEKLAVGVAIDQPEDASFLLLARHKTHPLKDGTRVDTGMRVNRNHGE